MCFCDTSFISCVQMLDINRRQVRMPHFNTFTPNNYDTLPHIVYYARARRVTGSKHCFCPSVRPTVHQSVRPSVSYIANNSIMQRPSVPSYRRKVFHLRCDSHSSFNVKTSELKITRAITADTSYVISYERRYNMQGQR